MDIQRPINTVPFEGRLTAEMREHVTLRAREMQAEVTRAMLASAWRHLTSFSRPLLARLDAWWQRYETERRLMALSDRMLADIGIAREDIPRLTRGIDPKTAPQTAGWLSDLGVRLAAWWERHEAQRRLMALSDRMLADIGIAREDIPLVARGVDPQTGPQATGRLGALRTRLAAARRARSEWRRVCGELMRYSDRELDDLGIRRCDIPRLTRESAAAAA